jgi:predicted O-methyltransferase YrrM
MKNRIRTRIGHTRFAKWIIQSFCEIPTIKILIDRSIHVNSPLQLHALAEMGGRFKEKPEDVISEISNPSTSNILESGIIFPNFYDTNPGTLKLLAMLVERIKPLVVVETGTANGKSASEILSAFGRNNLTESRLFSIDVDPRVATNELRSNEQFSFLLIDKSNSFVDLMKTIEKVDLFYHDSDHSYRNQMLEYVTAWEILDNEKGCLISDDINWSNAFLDFCKHVNRKPSVLADHGKFSGVLFKSND